LNWEQFDGEEGLFTEQEANRLRYVAATRAGTCLVISQRAAGNSKNPWVYFEPYLPASELALPGESAVLVTPTSVAEVELSDGDISAAFADIQVRWAANAQPTYATATAKALSLTGAEFVRNGPGDVHGTEWGTVVHLLLKARMDNPTVDLAALAISALNEQGLSIELADQAIRVVNSISRSQIWRRAQASNKRLVEVPFGWQRPADGATTNVPLIVRGAIDLVFKEEQGWVVVDYKTDASALGGLNSLVEKYRPQVALYAEAWEAITGESVTERGLFFTGVDQYIAI
jgi:ATP-dependent helicase/nuclease subunit A